MEFQISDESDREENKNDWYRDSDTSEDVPDPNDSEEALYQKADTLPVSLHKKHFEEGRVYTMTLAKNHRVHLLIMIIARRQSTFIYRTFFSVGAKRKTFHEGRKDQVSSYDAVWRLAPRERLCQKGDLQNIHGGQTLRFKYGMEDEYTTVLVLEVRSRDWTGRIEAGRDRGKNRVYEFYEMTDTIEIFGSSLVQSLRAQLNNLV